MSPHLTSEQIVDAMVDPNDARYAAHLAACAECQARLEAERNCLTAFKNSAEIGSRRSEAYWTRQTLVLSCRVAEMERARRTIAVWAAAAAAVVLLAAALSWELIPARGSASAAVMVTARTHAANAKPQDPDELLLSRLERTLDRDGPAALAPAELVAGELSHYRPAKRQANQGTSGITNRAKISTGRD